MSVRSRRIRSLELCDANIFGQIVITKQTMPLKNPRVRSAVWTQVRAPPPILPGDDPKEYEKRRASVLLDQLLLDIYSNLQSGCSDYNSATSTKSLKTTRSDIAHIKRQGVEDLRSSIGSLEDHVVRVGSILVRQLKRRDALRRQRDAHCDVISYLLRKRLPEFSPEMRFSIEPLPGDSGFSQWHSAMKMVSQLPEGIPPEFRRRLWLSLADKHLTSEGIDWSAVERSCFSEWSHPSDAELGVQIVKDLHRTGCSLFCGKDGQENQALLKKVLLAYARWNKAVGYCQGFNMLAALILQVTEKCETDALKLMIYLIEGVLPDSYFADSLRGLSVDMAVFRELLRTKLPRLSKHLDTLQVASKEGTTSYEPPLTNVFTMQWFLTLFCNCLPQPTVLRVWDLILLEGNEILLRTSLAIWQVLGDRILTAKTADEFYCVMGTLMREILEYDLIDANTLVRGIVSIGPLTELNTLREHYLYNINPWGSSAPADPDKRLKVYHKDRLILDIGVLKKQYTKLKQRQRQAHIIFNTAVARQTSRPAPIAMNHLLLGKSALVPAKRLGPPKGAVPPARVPPPKPQIAQPVRTLHWKDTGRRDSSSSSTSSSDTELCDEHDASSDEDDAKCQLPDDNLKEPSDTKISTEDNTITLKQTSASVVVSDLMDFETKIETDNQIEIDEIKSDIFDNTDNSDLYELREIHRSDSTVSEDGFDFEKFLEERVKSFKEKTYSSEESIDDTSEQERLKYARRNSVRALEIIQENSLILHRILQCQSRMTPTPPPTEEEDIPLTNSEENSLNLNIPELMPKDDQDEEDATPTNEFSSDRAADEQEVSRSESLEGLINKYSKIPKSSQENVAINTNSPASKSAQEHADELLNKYSTASKPSDDTTQNVEDIINKYSKDYSTGTVNIKKDTEFAISKTQTSVEEQVLNTNMEDFSKNYTAELSSNVNTISTQLKEQEHNVIDDNKVVESVNMAEDVSKIHSNKDDDADIEQVDYNLEKYRQKLGSPITQEQNVSTEANIPVSDNSKNAITSIDMNKDKTASDKNIAVVKSEIGTISHDNTTDNDPIKPRENRVTTSPSKTEEPEKKSIIENEEYEKFKAKILQESSQNIQKIIEDRRNKVAESQSNLIAKAEIKVIEKNKDTKEEPFEENESKTCTTDTLSGGEEPKQLTEESNKHKEQTFVKIQVQDLKLTDEVKTNDWQNLTDSTQDLVGLNSQVLKKDINNDQEELDRIKIKHETQNFETERIELDRISSFIENELHEIVNKNPTSENKLVFDKTVYNKNNTDKVNTLNETQNVCAKISYAEDSSVTFDIHGMSKIKQENETLTSNKTDNDEANKIKSSINKDFAILQQNVLELNKSLNHPNEKLTQDENKGFQFANLTEDHNDSNKFDTHLESPINSGCRSEDRSGLVLENLVKYKLGEFDNDYPSEVFVDKLESPKSVKDFSECRRPSLPVVKEEMEENCSGKDRLKDDTKQSQPDINLTYNTSRDNTFGNILFDKEKQDQESEVGNVFTEKSLSNFGLSNKTSDELKEISKAGVGEGRSVEYNFDFLEELCKKELSKISPQSNEESRNDACIKTTTTISPINKTNDEEREDQTIIKSNDKKQSEYKQESYFEIKSNKTDFEKHAKDKDSTNESVYSESTVHFEEGLKHKKDMDDPEKITRAEIKTGKNNFEESLRHKKDSSSDEDVKTSRDNIRRRKDSSSDEEFSAFKNLDYPRRRKDSSSDEDTKKKRRDYSGVKEYEERIPSPIDIFKTSTSKYKYEEEPPAEFDYRESDDFLKRSSFDMDQFSTFKEMNDDERQLDVKIEVEQAENKSDTDKDMDLKLKANETKLRIHIEDCEKRLSFDERQFMKIEDKMFIVEDKEKLVKKYSDGGMRYAKRDETFDKYDQQMESVTFTKEDGKRSYECDINKRQSWIEDTDGFKRERGKFQNDDFGREDNRRAFDDYSSKYAPSLDKYKGGSSFEARLDKDFSDYSSGLQNERLKKTLSLRIEDERYWFMEDDDYLNDYKKRSAERRDKSPKYETPIHKRTYSDFNESTLAKNDPPPMHKRVSSPDSTKTFEVPVFEDSLRKSVAAEKQVEYRLSLREDKSFGAEKGDEYKLTLRENKSSVPEKEDEYRLAYREEIPEVKKTICCFNVVDSSQQERKRYSLGIDEERSFNNDDVTQSETYSSVARAENRRSFHEDYSGLHKTLDCDGTSSSSRVQEEGNTEKRFSSQERSESLYEDSARRDKSPRKEMASAEEMIEVSKTSKYTSILEYSRNLDERFNNLILKAPGPNLNYPYNAESAAPSTSNLLKSPKTSPKSPAKSPSHAYNPFPVSISSRQNKEVAVRLGLYKKP